MKKFNKSLNTSFHWPSVIRIVSRRPVGENRKIVSAGDNV